MRMIETALEECNELRASLIRRAVDKDDAVAIATAFAMQSKLIYEELGGPRMVAAQFYGLADSAIK